MAAKDLLQTIYNIALQSGLDAEGARVAMAIARTEGALDGSVGDNGQSWGPFQFHTGGMLPAYATSLGVSVSQAGKMAQANPEAAAKWALSGYLGQAIRQGQAQGLRGAELATYAQQNGQRSQHPERAGANYRAMSGEGGGSPPAGNPDVDGTDGVPKGRGRNTAAMLNAIMDRVTSLEERRVKLDKELGELEAQLSKIDPRNFMAAQSKRDEIAAKRKEIAGVDTQINQAYGQQVTASRALDQLLNANQASLSGQIAAGQLTLNQAKAAWDNVLSNAAVLMKAAPMTGTRAMTEAIRQSIMNYGQFGIKPVDIGEMPLIPLSMASAGGGMLPQAEEAPYRAAVMNAVKAGVSPSPLVLDPKSGITADDDIDTMADKLLGREAPETEAMTDRGTVGLSSTANPYAEAQAGPMPPDLNAVPADFSQRTSAVSPRPPAGWPFNVRPAPGPPSTAVPTPGPALTASPTPAAASVSDAYELPEQLPGESDDDYVERIKRMYGAP